MSPVLLVHGAWHGAWCWAGVLERLLAAGVPAVAADTPGHGPHAPVPEAFLTRDAEALRTAPSPLATMTVADHAAPVIGAVRALHERSGPVTLVGHSLGGVTVHAVAEAVPDLLSRTVYLAAFSPAPGRSVLDDVARPGFATSEFSALPVADPSTVGVVRIDWRSEDAAYRAACRSCFYADVPDDLARAATELLTPDEPANLYGEPATITAERFGRVPRAFIRCTQDRAVPVQAQDEAIAAVDQAMPEHRFETRTLDGSHSPFLSMPDELAGVLLDLAGR